MPRKTLISWSGGKDSAWMLHLLRQDSGVELAGLLCTVNAAYGRVTMHGVPAGLLQRQADAVGLALDLIEIPEPCSDAVYKNIMAAFVTQARQRGVECIAFGDLFLEDVRRYREARLQGTGIEPLFPLWGIPTDRLSRDIVASGFRALITCIDPGRMPERLVGQEYNECFLQQLPADVDPCGENGEFHSFVFDGPVFRERLAIAAGVVIRRDGFVFADVTATRGERHDRHTLDKPGG